MGFKGLLRQDTVLLNYSILENAGDRFNFDFLSDYFNLAPSKYSFGKRSHFLFCGSILGRSNSYSVLLGAGFISEDDAQTKIDFSEVVGLRGEHSLRHVQRDHPRAKVEFLGDPGLLAREVVEPVSSPPGRYVIGIIPHFVDYNIASMLVKGQEEIRLIDITKPYREVCERIKKCSVILSSSLHGLIFSDAMDVPNVWVVFSKKIKGGNFKYLDYYSVMTNSRYSPYICVYDSDLWDAAKAGRVSENPFYDSMLESVRERFKDFAKK